MLDGAPGTARSVVVARCVSPGVKVSEPSSASPERIVPSCTKTMVVGFSAGPGGGSVSGGSSHRRVVLELGLGWRLMLALLVVVEGARCRWSARLSARSGVYSGGGSVMVDLKAPGECLCR